MDFFSVGHNFGILERRSRAYITAACAPWRIGYAEYIILRYLYDHEGVCQDEIAGHLFADKAQVARNVKTLEEKNYIVRCQDDHDKRFKHIYLTPQGEVLRQPLQLLLDHWIARLTEGMDPGLVAKTIEGMKAAAKNATETPLEGLQAKEEVIK
ncbi:MAG: MarR family winged helix-turn-helix transcriptional regulator [Megasphaera sp.]|jgi:DNA-binding MarR family transcriptional regulator|nr:MarR family winged helix-turn-helix transcriptional regulator [Megasphaera sp.]MCH4187400.1 MarR family winged helix-turn-helix transcriptional regulator [Megasphaera sp.]MCH4217319.1 MarR family winged helix-turn-helix transcriptional regulator [Megasphaera sp.]